MNPLSPRYRTRQLLNKRWIAEFKKWPWSRWKTIAIEGGFNSTYVFSDGDQQGESDTWYTSSQKALEAFSWLGFVDPELIDEGEELFPEETVINVASLDVEKVGSHQHVHHEQNLEP